MGERHTELPLSVCICLLGKSDEVFLCSSREHCVASFTLEMLSTGSTQEKS